MPADFNLMGFTYVREIINASLILSTNIEPFQIENFP